MNNLSGVATWLILTFGLLALPHDAVAQAATEAAPAAGSTADADEDIYELMKMFVDTLDEVQRNYVEPISRRELMEAAIDGVLSKLDAYSDFIPREDIDEFRRDVESEFGGIGIQVQMEGAELKVISPLPGSPGIKAGLRAGDTILEVDGQVTTGKQLEDSVALMKGRIGTEVSLLVRHLDGQVVRINVRRDNVQIETVVSHKRQADGSWRYMFDDQDKIGYVRITTFSGHTDEELKETLTALKANGMRGLILDLRFNPGGLLSTAIAVSDLFLSQGRIVSTSGRGADAQQWDATPEGTFSDFPMVVLVNRYSASASEVVSACLQDHQRAVIIGNRTWGKGSVQKVIELERGRSALKLTTSSYMRPSGKNIHRAEGATDSDEWGVKPDPGMNVPVTQSEEQRILIFQRESFTVRNPQDGQIPVFIDSQLQRAINVIKSRIGVPAFRQQ